MSDDSKEWRWVGEDGAQKTLSEQELIAELSSEALPHYTLVWRKGWTEWLPAMQVQELAWALPPGKADDPATPKERATANSPPAPPLYRYPVIKRRAQNLKSDKPPPDRPLKVPRPLEPSPAKPSSVPPPADPAPEPSAPSAPEVPSPTAGSATEGSVPTRPRSEQPEGPSDGAGLLSEPPLSDETTLEPDEEIHEVDAELDESRPDASMGGFGSAPDAVGAYAYGDEDNAETRVLPGRALPTGEATYVAPHAPPPAEPRAVEDATMEAEPQTGPSTEPPAADEGMPELPRLPPPPPAPAGFSEYAAAPRTGPPRYVYALVAVIVVLGISLVFVSKGPDETTGTVASGAGAPSAAGSVPAAGEAAEAAPSIPCAVSHAAVQMAPAAYPGVQPTFAPVPQTERLAVGFADGKTALGMTIDPSTLDRDHVFQQSERHAVVAATPTTASDKLAFQVIREGDPISPAAVVNASLPFIIGLHKEAISRDVVTGSDEPPSSVWDGIRGDITTPRVATVHGTGHAITFRVGGKNGSVRAGWMTRDGARLSELSEIKTDAEFVGTPDIGGNEGGALVAFAARRPGQQDWGVQTARMALGAEAQAATWFDIPPGGPGQSAISPIVAGLDGERWLIAWTEGSAGNREVRLQVLSSDGKPLGPPSRVSPPGANAGQGALWVRGHDALVVFFVEGDDRHELWGASVHCPGP